jgi:signal transduction histidine kinase
MKRKEAVAALVAGALIVFALLTVFAIELSDNQAKSKQDIEARVHERSVLAGALIDSLFDSTVKSIPQDAKTFGARTVPSSLLDKQAGRNAYAVLLTSAGGVVAGSRGFTAQARADLAQSATLKLLRTGKLPWALGNVLPYGKTGVINYGLALPTPSGERYLLTGFVPSALDNFLAGDLRQIPGVKGAHNYVLDGRGVVISSTNPARPTGYVFHTPTQLDVLGHNHGDVSAHYFDQVRLTNSTWRILLVAPNGPLFASVSGLRHWLPWLIFIAFGLVAIATLFLARRTLRDSDRVTEANAQLTEANSELAEAKLRLEETIGALAASNGALELTNSELERRARELARSNAELDQFASIASHDLQEPLRKVRTFTERITKTEAENLSERGIDYLQRANASAERMQRLIEDLLRYSRVSTQGRPFTQVDLGRVTDEVLDDLDDQIQRSGATVRRGDLPRINADASQMRQLIQNLVSNALKFTRPNVPPEVEIDGKAESGWVTFTVGDNGIGFDPQYSRRIFRVFERLHGRGSYAGTGIGLALCRKIAERHGGTVVAQSVLDQGSTFTVTMQAQRTEAVSDVPASGETGSAPAPAAVKEEPYVAA